MANKVPNKFFKMSRKEGIFFVVFLLVAGLAGVGYYSWVNGGIGAFSGSNFAYSGKRTSTSMYTYYKCANASSAVNAGAMDPVEMSSNKKLAKSKILAMSFVSEVISETGAPFDGGTTYFNMSYDLTTNSAYIVSEGSSGAGQVFCGKLVNEDDTKVKTNAEAHAYYNRSYATYPGDNMKDTTKFDKAKYGFTTVDGTPVDLENMIAGKQYYFFAVNQPGMVGGKSGRVSLGIGFNYIPPAADEKSYAGMSRMKPYLVEINGRNYSTNDIGNAWIGTTSMNDSKYYLGNHSYVVYQNISYLNVEKYVAQMSSMFKKATIGLNATDPKKSSLNVFSDWTLGAPVTEQATTTYKFTKDSKTVAAVIYSTFYSALDEKKIASGVTYEKYGNNNYMVFPLSGTNPFVGTAESSVAYVIKHSKADDPDVAVILSKWTPAVTKDTILSSLKLW